MLIQDLHSHTVYSDGADTPDELLAKAHEVGLQKFAVTDHDTVEAQLFCVDEARKYNFEYLPGIEVKTRFEGQKLELLGHGVDINDSLLREETKKIKETRRERMVQLLKRWDDFCVENEVPELKVTLEEIGLHTNFISCLIFDKAGDKFRDFSPQEQARIAHMFKLMGYPGLKTLGWRDWGIKHMINKDQPVYVSKAGIPQIPFETCIKLGINVLSSPGEHPLDEPFIEKMVGAGLKGLEVHTPKHTAEQKWEYSKIAERFGLVITCGSDYHGWHTPRRRLGYFAKV